MDINPKIQIDKERTQIFSNEVSIEIWQPCTLDSGIVVLDDKEWTKFRSIFNQDQQEISFFIPASGSGSRMFEFIQAYLDNPCNETLGPVEKFFKNLKSFAFYAQLKDDWKNISELDNLDWNEWLSHLLSDEGMNYSQRPKALFPFHKYGNVLKSPIEEHLYQGALWKDRPIHFHFTIQENFQDEIELKVNIEDLSPSIKVSYSYQNPNSDAFVFDADAEALKSSSHEYLRRPSGHGALLENLAVIQSPYIFIKNIDNVSCRALMPHSNSVYEGLGGLLIELKHVFVKILEFKDISLLNKINERFSIYHESELNQETSWEEMVQLLMRPLRICGMVANDGQPGGGPFWIKDKNKVSKQIIEKSQLSSPTHLNHLLKSTHFNPVVMAISTQDPLGQSLNLWDFVNQDLGIINQKVVGGERIKFLEKPGLWNGSMYHWNSVFVEIPSDVFTPVKNVMDLLDSRHSCV